MWNETSSRPEICAQALDVVGDRRMIGAEHRAQVAHPFRAVRDAVLVEVMPEKIDPVGAGQVVEHVAVKIGDRHAGRRCQKGSRRKMLTDKAAVLERHAIGTDELQVGDAARGLGASARWSWRNRSRYSADSRMKPSRRRAATSSGAIVGAEELSFVILVERDQRGDSPSHPGMPGERSDAWRATGPGASWP